MLPRSIGDILDDGDYSESVITVAQRDALFWYDPEGDRGKRYNSVEQAVQAAIRGGIHWTAIIIDMEDGTYELSIQYDHFA